MSSERVLTFPCAEAQLIGILHEPAAADSPLSHTGVVIVVGGPQYRVGSHRQFVLLARQLAAAGIPVLRFDYRGMGDSTGEARDFEQIDADIRAACDALCAANPAVRQLVLWGLCDAASAALFYAHTDARVAGLVLLNPWLRQAQAQAKTVIQHYYKQRLFSAGLWRKLLRGEFDFRASLRSLLTTLRQASAGNRASANAAGTETGMRGSLSERMAQGWQKFNGPIQLILSGDDLVAREFETVSSQQPEWRGLLSAARVQQLAMPAANHTFARAEWRDAVATATRDFVLALPSKAGPT
ncbi:hydrolase 1, exosortase A system-associated [Permianibacter sp. IMCC34836]|nr:hydrolase 1, exosortase A system-associated [Permianibacter fluminis]